MTLPHTCPYCGSPTEVPQLFTRTRQKIFFYIWDNPGCTQKEIARAVGALGISRVQQHDISVHLSVIRRKLLDGGVYALHSTRGTKPWHYKIIHQRPVDTSPQESANGTGQCNRRVP